MQTFAPSFALGGAFHAKRLAQIAGCDVNIDPEAVGIE